MLLSLLKRLWVFISPHRRKQICLLMILIIFTSFTEVIAIGAILPFLAALTAPETVYNHALAQPIISLLEIDNSNQLILPLAIGFASAAIFAGILRVLLLLCQTRLGCAIGTDLGLEIYRSTLHQPYSVHVASNSSEIIAAITTKTNQIVGGILHPSMIMLSSSFLTTVILVTLISINPVIALTGGLGIGMTYIVIVFATKKMLLKNSQRLSRGASKVVKIVQEGLGAIRDVLIDGTQNSYCKAFKTEDVIMRYAQANTYAISLMPRYGIEAISMVLIAVIAYGLAQTPEGLVGSLPVLGAFAVGAQRLLPSLQQVYSSYSSMRGNQIPLQDTLELMERDTKPVPSNPVEPLTFQKEIKLESLSFRYQPEEPWVLADINISIPKGIRVGFVGTTGSGKSTLLDIIMGLLQPTTGKLIVDSQAVDEWNYRSWQAHIAHVPQTIFLIDASIAENIAFGVSKDQINYELLHRCAQQAQLADTIESWDLQYQTPVGERGVRLSGGQRQRIGIARALYKQSEILVFDEATSALDNITEQAVMDAIDNIEKDTTILIVAHRLTTLSSCDLIVELENGVIKRSGTYSEIVG